LAQVHFCFLAMEEDGRKNGFRLIVHADEGAAGGSSGARMKKFDSPPLSIEQLMHILKDHFEVTTREIHFVGVDGGRKAKVTNDTELSRFFLDRQGAGLATLEAHPTSTAATKAKERNELVSRRADERENHLATENSALRIALLRVEQRVKDLEVKEQSGLDEMKRLVTKTQSSIQSAHSDSLAAISRKIVLLQEESASFKSRIDEIKEVVDTSTAEAGRHRLKLDEDFSRLEREIANTFDDTAKEIRELETSHEDVVATIDAEIRRDLADHDRRLQQLLNVKVSKAEWTEENRRIDEQAAENLQWTKDALQDEATERTSQDTVLSVRIDETNSLLDEFKRDTAQYQAVEKQFCQSERDALMQDMDEKHTSVQDRVTAVIADVERRDQEQTAALEALNTDLRQRMEDEHNEMTQKVDNHVADIDQRANDIARRLDQDVDRVLGVVDGKSTALSSQIIEVLTEGRSTAEQMQKEAEAAFRATHDRIDSAETQLRTEFTEVSKFLSEQIIQVKQDFKEDIELFGETLLQKDAAMSGIVRELAKTVTRDIDGLTAEMNRELQAMQQKLDVTKAQLDDCQVRVTGDKEDAARQFAERDLRLRAQHMQLQEATAALKQIMEAMKDEHKSFRESQTFNVGVLQHEHTATTEAIALLEKERKALKKDTREVQSYCQDMKVWAEQVERRFIKVASQLQPNRVEWRIHSISQKRRNLQQPQFLRSDTFTLGKIFGLRIDFHPNGFHGATPGAASIRLYAPSGVHIRFEMAIGRQSLGTRDFQSGIESLWDEREIMGWEDEVTKDSVAIIVEVLRDYSSEEVEDIGSVVYMDTE